MSQQEMSFEGSHAEHSPEYAQHYSAQYGQSQIAQKLPRRALSRKAATRIQLWTAYVSLFIVMILSFSIGGQDWGTMSGVLIICYPIIIAINILVFIVVNFNVKVTRKLRQ